MCTGSHLRGGVYINALTNPQKAILKMLRSGMRPTAIALEHGCSPSWVCKQLGYIFKKLSIQSYGLKGGNLYFTLAELDKRLGKLEDTEE